MLPWTWPSLGDVSTNRLTAFIQSVLTNYLHNYLTLVYQIDHACKRLLWIGDDRTAATFTHFFEWLGPDRCKMP